MASLFQEDLHSSDSEDDDYVPDPRELCSDDNDESIVLSDDEIKIKKNAKKSDILFSEDEINKTLEESTSTKSKIDEKRRANDLFKNFLQEVEAEMKVKESDISPGNTYNSPVLSSDSGIKSNGTSYENSSGKPSCELFDFAGETVVISVKDDTKIASTEESTKSEFKRNNSVNLKECDEPAEEPPVVKRKGLQSVLGTIMNKKQKLTTLEKSSLDWNSFKREHGISEELEKFNKGRGGYIERQRFLQRSDVKCYEIERDLRLFKSKKNC